MSSSHRRPCTKHNAVLVPAARAEGDDDGDDNDDTTATTAAADDDDASFRNPEIHDARLRHTHSRGRRNFYKTFTCNLTVTCFRTVIRNDEICHRNLIIGDVSDEMFYCAFL